MWRFHWILVRQIPVVLWTAANRWKSIAAFILFLLTLVNRRFGGKLVNSWHAISPWWAFLPVGLLFVYGLMRSNYEHFKQMESDFMKTISGLQGQLDEIKGQFLLLDEQTRLSPEEVEILIAVMKADPERRNISTVSDQQFIMAGCIYFTRDSEPEDSARYVYAVHSLLQGGYIRRDDTDYYVLTAKGFQKGEELIRSSNAERIFANLTERFRENA